MIRPVIFMSIFSIIFIIFIIISMVGLIYITKLIFNTDSKYCIHLNRSQRIIVKNSIVVIWIVLIFNLIGDISAISDVPFFLLLRMALTILAMVGLAFITNVPFKDEEKNGEYCVNLNRSQIVIAKMSIIIIWIILVITLIGLIVIPVLMSKKSITTRRIIESPIILEPSY